MQTFSQYGVKIIYCHTERNVLELIRVKVKVKFTLEQATKAQRKSRGIALLFL
jgi:hypothetical protein